jgi:hypothetical protein
MTVSARPGADIGRSSGTQVDTLFSERQARKYAMVRMTVDRASRSPVTLRQILAED